MASKWVSAYFYDVQFDFYEDKEGEKFVETILTKKLPYRPVDRELRKVIAERLKSDPELQEKALRKYFVIVTVGYKPRVAGSFLEIYDRAVLYSPSPRDEQMKESETASPN